MRIIAGCSLALLLVALVGLAPVEGQVRLCNGVGRRYCAKAHLAKECPKTCLPERCRGRRRVGYRRCAAENWRTCYDYKWEQVANYGWYDLVYLDGSRLCLGTCREEPEAMRCLNNEYLWYKGRKYCQMSDCRRARMGVQSGCHQERDFHQPTCFECSIVFATGCAPLYTQEDLDDSKPGKAEGNRRYRPYPDPPNRPTVKPGRPSPPAENEQTKPEPVNPTQPQTQPGNDVQSQPAQPNESDPQPNDAATEPDTAQEVLEGEGDGYDEDYAYDSIEDINEEDYEVPEDPLDAAELFSDNSPTTEVIEASVQLQIPPEEFDNENAARIVSAISNVAGVAPQDVEVVSSAPADVRRKLLQSVQSELQKEPVTTVNTIVVTHDLQGALWRIEDADRTGHLKREMDSMGVEYLPMSLTSRIVVVPRSMLPTQTAEDVQQTRTTVLAAGVSAAAIIALLAVSLLVVRCTRKAPQPEAAASPEDKASTAKDNAVAVEAINLQCQIPAHNPNQQ